MSDEPSVELSFSEEMIAQVIREWQEENPLRTPESLTADEFTRRMMIEIKATARIVK